MPRHRIVAPYEQLLEFERGRLIGLKEAGWENRRVTRHMGRIDATIRRCKQEWVDIDRFQRNDGTSYPRATVYWESILIDKSAVTMPDSSLSIIRHWNHADWGRMVFSDEFRFQLCKDNHRRRVWRRPEQRADSAFAIVRHTSPQPGVMI
ncbi:transposable element Tc1 transposase [Trichonephila clavipes]|nr:transposable element Tc1 transposase [Trichonephila clavipes]